MEGRDKYFLDIQFSGVFVPSVKMIPLSRSVQMAAIIGTINEDQPEEKYALYQQCCRYVFSAKGEVKKDVYEQFLDIVG